MPGELYAETGLCIKWWLIPGLKVCRFMARRGIRKPGALVASWLLNHSLYVVWFDSMPRKRRKERLKGFDVCWTKDGEIGGTIQDDEESPKT